MGWSRSRRSVAYLAFLFKQQRWVMDIPRCIFEDHSALVGYLEAFASERKLRLFLVACAVSMSDLMTDDSMRSAVTFAEQFADGFGTDSERIQWASRLHAIPIGDHPVAGFNWFRGRDQGEVAAYFLSQLAVSVLVGPGRRLAWRHSWKVVTVTTEKLQPTIAKELFGDPTNPVSFNPDWRTTEVVEIAQAIYDHKAFGHMPMLATALEKAHCTNPALLSHCREREAHHRGCWVIDLILDKH